jgi:hypothetical protein
MREVPDGTRHCGSIGTLLLQSCNI